jgi:hypothetical protein
MWSRGIWSRGIAAIALCVTCVTATLAALPGPAAGAGQGASGQSSLMTALELAPAAVATWKRAQSASVSRPKGKGRVKSRLDPFRITVFAGS